MRTDVSKRPGWHAVIVSISLLAGLLTAGCATSKASINLSTPLVIDEMLVRKAIAAPHGYFVQFKNAKGDLAKMADVDGKGDYLLCTFWEPNRRDGGLALLRIEAKGLKKIDTLKNPQAFAVTPVQVTKTQTLAWLEVGKWSKSQQFFEIHNGKLRQLGNELMGKAEFIDFDADGTQELVLSERPGGPRIFKQEEIDKLKKSLKFEVALNPSVKSETTPAVFTWNEKQWELAAESAPEYISARVTALEAVLKEIEAKDFPVTRLRLALSHCETANLQPEAGSGYRALRSLHSLQRHQENKKALEILNQRTKSLFGRAEKDVSPNDVAHKLCVSQARKALAAITSLEFSKKF